MTEELPVHVSRNELHGLEVPASFEATGSFDVRLINHGEALHVHLHLNDTLSTVASLDASNHYVEGDAERAVRVTVDDGKLDQEPTLGKLKVASAYGAETRWIDVELAEPDPEADSVRVDDALARPRRPDSPDPVVESPAALVVGVGLVAVLVSGVAAAVVGDPLVAGGALVVVVGFLVALMFLLRETAASP